MRPKLLLAALAALAFATVLTTAAASARAPDAAQMRASGWKVAWPVKGERATLRPGAVLRVTVAPLAKRAPPKRATLRVALTQLGIGGKPVRTIAQRRLRRGTFRVALPKGDGRAYTLTLTAGKRRWATTIATPPAPVKPVVPPPPAPAPAPAPAAPTTPPMPQFQLPCAGIAGVPAATLTFDTPTVVAGQPARYTFVNSGAACLMYGSGYTWQHMVGDAWQPIPGPWDRNNWLPTILRPGESETGALDVRWDSEPGRYRLEMAVRAWSSADVVTVSAEYEVTAPDVTP